ncbi:hypothetical protein IV102_09280 [bacterium]|nr:hypothetical protein [bacterium]
MEFPPLLSGLSLSFSTRKFDYCEQGSPIGWFESLFAPRSTDPVALRGTALRGGIRHGFRWVRQDGEQIFTMAVGFADAIESLKRLWAKPFVQKVFKAGSRKNQPQHMRACCQLTGKAVIDGQRVDIKATDVSAPGARTFGVAANGHRKH